jgi:hypothetical protein
MVCGGDGLHVLDLLSRLVDKSLVIVEADAAPAARAVQNLLQLTSGNQHDLLEVRAVAIGCELRVGTFAVQGAHATGRASRCWRRNWVVLPRAFRQQFFAEAVDAVDADDGQQVLCGTK